MTRADLVKWAETHIPDRIAFDGMSASVLVTMYLRGIRSSGAVEEYYGNHVGYASAARVRRYTAALDVLHDEFKGGPIQEDPPTIKDLFQAARNHINRDLRWSVFKYLYQEQMPTEKAIKHLHCSPGLTSIYTGSYMDALDTVRKIETSIGGPLQLE